MIGALAVTVVVYAVALAGWIVAQAYRPAADQAVTRAALIVLELGLVVLACAHLGAVLAGHRPADPAVHLAYAGASVGLLPLTVAIGAGDARSRGMTAAVGCTAVAVVVIRLQVTA